MSNKRGTDRRRVLKAGLIGSSGGSISCTVRNLSATGAAIEVESQIGIPAKFSLSIPSDSLVRNCRVVWRKERRLGVAFD